MTLCIFKCVMRVWEMQLMNNKVKKRREKWIKSQITIYKTGKLMWLWKSLFLIKGLSIIEGFTVGNESFSTVSHGYLKMENLNFSICCNHHCYLLHWTLWKPWMSVSNKKNYCGGSEFYDISYFPLTYMFLGYR